MPANDFYKGVWKCVSTSFRNVRQGTKTSMKSWQRCLGGVGSWCWDIVQSCAELLGHRAELLGHCAELLGPVLEHCSAPPQNTDHLIWNVKPSRSSCLAAWLPSCRACCGRCRSLRRWGSLAAVGQSVQALKTIHRLQSLPALLPVHHDP